ncbi:hypothetical protein [Streptococcus uberis]|uniref:hypothetical protein n=1 Tax=Streptococcus uberis TaxID=1349 RepID=UPI003D6B91F0
MRKEGLKRVEAKKMFITKLENYFLKIIRTDNNRKSSQTELEIKRFQGQGTLIRCKTKDFLIVINVYGKGKTIMNYYTFMEKYTDILLIEDFDDYSYTKESLDLKIKEILEVIKSYS